MRRATLTAVCLFTLALTISPTHAAATRWWQAVPGDRVIDGALSPADGSAGYVRYGQKRFGTHGSFGFDVVVGVARAGHEHEPVTIPARRSEARGRVHTPHTDLMWLPSGRYLFAGLGGRDAGGWLLRADGTSATKAGPDRTGRWFVTNDEVRLTYADMMTLRLLIGGGGWHPRWRPPYRHASHSWRGPRDPQVTFASAQPLSTGHPLRLASLNSADVAGGAEPFAAINWTVGSRAGAAPTLWFTCGDDSPFRPSPNYGHDVYFGRPDGEPDQGVSGSTDLWVQRADGSGRRRLVGGAGVGSEQWLDSRWVAYSTPTGDGYPAERQLGIVNIHTGRSQLLTEGDYHHTLVDYRDGRFLITETPTREDGGQHAEYTSKLYIIEPLRVRM